MHKIELPWKSFNVHLPAVEEWIKAQDTPNYTGCSADYLLTLWFSEVPDTETLEMINEFWDKLDKFSPVAVAYVPQQDFEEKLAALKAGIPGRKWDDLSAVEQKIVMGITPSHQDLGFSD